MVFILDKSYDSKRIEEKWRKKWAESRIHSFDPKKPGKVYSFDTPPPFTSGTLHMGHIYNHTWIDIVARYKRMQGFNVYLPQGFDCHGLPTELKVEKELKVRKENRDEFLMKCKEWTESAVARMKTQFDSVGYSTDWDYTYKTMDDSYKAMVQKTLLQFFDKHVLYREKHPVLWCPKCETALAKAETGHIEKEGKLYHIDLECVGDCKGHKLTIATTRPEMMPACVAVLVHPKDERYTKFVGENVALPIFNKEVPVISDEAVEKDFGTGVVYLCTFGDEQDIAWQKKYKLPVIEAVDVRGRMTVVAGKYAGLKAAEARMKIVEDLTESGNIRKIDPIKHNVLSHVERSSCLAPIELLPKEQWFIKVRDYTKDIVEKANEMKWHPGFMKQRLIDWSESMDWDWIISRQRVFGTPIPFWVCACGEVIHADLSELPVDPRGTTRKCQKCGGDAVGEKDVCDCWVDSSVSPLRVSKWDSDKEFFDKVYPISLRPQGYEIIRTWTFYTIFRNFILTNKACFDELMINGMVCGPDGRKMSKSLGNIIEPEEVMKRYSADSIRQWASGGKLGDDYPFSWEECEHSQKFLIKLWNVSRFMEMHLQDYTGEAPKEFSEIDKWVLSKLQRIIKDSTEKLEGYQFDAPLESVRTYLWFDIADNYMEMVKHRLYKPEIYGIESRKAAQYTIHRVLETAIELLLPYTPFVCDEIRENVLKHDCSKPANWPKAEEKLINPEAEEIGETAKDIISQIRKYKSDKGISLGAELEYVKISATPDNYAKLEKIKTDIAGTGKIKELELSESENIEKYIISFEKLTTSA